jgi:HAD superfamily hydrolase (TIGR01509 family)
MTRYASRRAAAHAVKTVAIKALLFDYDGVLWDSEVAALESWRELFAAYGEDLPSGLFVTRLGTVGGVDLVAELEARIGTPLDRDAIALRRRERKMELLRRLTPRPGILSYVAEARDRRLAVAVVSTDDSEWITTGLEILGLQDAFDFIECAEGDTTRAKPSPALYLNALRRLRLSNHEAIAIEDSPNGIRSAKAARLFCLCYANAVTRQLDLSDADVVVDSLETLPLADVLAMAAAAR